MAEYTAGLRGPRCRREVVVADAPACEHTNRAGRIDTDFKQIEADTPAYACIFIMPINQPSQAPTPDVLRACDFPAYNSIANFPIFSEESYLDYIECHLGRPVPPPSTSDEAHATAVGFSSWKEYSALRHAPYWE